MKADKLTACHDTRESVAFIEFLNLARGEGLKSISNPLVLQPGEENGRLAIVKSAGRNGADTPYELGDADPGSVDDFLAADLLCVAETRTRACALDASVTMASRSSVYAARQGHLRS